MTVGCIKDALNARRSSEVVPNGYVQFVRSMAASQKCHFTGLIWILGTIDLGVWDERNNMHDFRDCGYTAL